jgi:hypothetical protein
MGHRLFLVILVSGVLAGEIAAQAVPVLSSPGNGAADEFSNTELAWNTESGAVSYGVEVSTASTFSSTVIDQAGITVASSAATVTGIISNLLPTTTYYWRAMATYASSSSSWSGAWSFVTIAAPQAAPTLAAPTNGAANISFDPLLTWNTLSGISEYLAAVSTSSGFSPSESDRYVTSASWQPTNLELGTSYYWHVAAYNGFNGPWSATWRFSTSDSPVLNAPSNGSVNEPLSVPLSWDTLNGASSYSVQVATGSGFSTTVFSQAGVTAVSGEDAYQYFSDAALGTTYYWRVNMKSGSATSAWSSIWKFSTVTALPAAPALASPSNNATGRPMPVTFSWSTVGGAEAYVMELSTSSGFTAIIAGGELIYADTVTVNGLTAATKYYWRAQAYNGAYGSWSTAWTFTTGTVAVARQGAPAALEPCSLENAVLSYRLQRPGMVEISIFDLRGRTAAIVNKVQAIGSYRLSLRNLSLSPGPYVLQFKAAGIVRRMPVVMGR